MKVPRSLAAPAALWASVLLVSCSTPPPPPGVDILSAEELGGPFPALNAEELARFEAGKELFGRTFLPENGLGPVSSERSCSACHGHPVVGGSGGLEHDDRAVHGARDGGCGLQGPLTAPPLWGRGLVEAVADGTLLALEDPDDVDGDGISGRVGRDASGRIGRFGRRAEVADLERLPVGADPVPDPEIEQADIDALADFVRFLAIPSRNLPAEEAERDRVTEGDRLFHEVGCAACHIPTLPTGPNPVEALGEKFVPLYSDLLLHDLGTGGTNPCFPGASASEFRTEILLGVSLRAGYLHDGSAATVAEAIAAHGSEGVGSRSAFDALSEAQRQALVAFVLSL